MGQAGQATEGQATEGQAKSIEITSGNEAQSASLSKGEASGDDTVVSQRIDASQLLAQKQGEIDYWKQVCMNALRQAQMLNTASEENRQRGDELEQHLQDLLQQQQQEKEARLMRKLTNSVGSIKTV